MNKFFYFCFLLGKLIREQIKKKIITLDNERLAIGLISIVGLGLLLPLLIIGPGLLESEWFLSFLTIPAAYGSFIADAAYLGRLWNLLTAYPYGEGRKTKIKTLFSQKVIVNRRIGYAEKLFTPIGMLLGVSVGIFCVSLHAVIPFLDLFSYFAYVLFILAYACSLGGLFNRLACSFDGTRLRQEKTAIVIGVFLGLMIALSLLAVFVLTGTMPFVPVISISKPLVDLLRLHKFLFALPFVLSLTSSTTACFDYFTKAYCFLRCACGTEDVLLRERVASRHHEYNGAFLGISCGCLLALGITIGLIGVGSLAVMPIAIVSTIFITIIMCNNVLAALFSRIGRFIDGIKRVSTPPREHAYRDEPMFLDAPKRSDLLTLTISDLTKSPRHRNEQSRVKLNRRQTSPAFFSVYVSEKESTEGDKEVFFNQHLSDTKPLSSVMA